MTKKLLILLVVCFSLVTVFSQVNNKEEAEKGLSYYEQGNFQEAFNTWSSLLDKGIYNGDLYYNLGNAALKSERKGEAMAAYLAAREYLPRDPDLKANINFVQKSIKDDLQVFSPRGFIDIVLYPFDFFTYKELIVVSMIFLFLSGVFFLGVFFEKIKFFSKIAMLFCGCFSLLVLGGSLLKTVTMAPWGAVIVDSTQVFSSPSSFGTPLFELKEGAPFLVLEQREDKNWVKIKISDGKKGWLNLKSSKVYELDL